MSIDDIAALLFDMDGTLVDSTPAIERAWSVWSAEYAVDAQAVLAFAHGRPAQSTVRHVCPHLDEHGVSQAAQRQLELQYTDLADVVAMPGVHVVLATLRQLNLVWAVVTSADARLARARLAAAGIELPRVLVTSDDVVNGKPDPSGYLLAAEQLQVPPGRCLVVEDSSVGLTAGRRAGAMTAALHNLDGDVRIADLAQLASILASAHC